jgi:hypothetical protein
MQRSYRKRPTNSNRNARRYYGLLHGANPATLVVNVAGGVGPFTYALDGNAAISSASTTHLLMLTNTMSSGANAYIHYSNIVIAPAAFHSIARLNLFSRASIGNPVITGGYGTLYLYGFVQCKTATAVASFPYTATVPGTYVFKQ